MFENPCEITIHLVEGQQGGEFECAIQPDHVCILKGLQGAQSVKISLTLKYGRVVVIGE